MEKTDRQTDSKARGTVWSLTIFDPEEYHILQTKDAWPGWLRQAKGQEEVAPTTGKHHWQCMIQTEQVRASSIKKLLPTAHIEIARNRHGLKNYVGKKETAVEGTQFDVSNDKEYLALHQQLEMLAVAYLEHEDDIKKILEELKPTEWDKKVFWFLANVILEADPTRASMLANPALERMWVNTRGTWVALAREASKEGDA